MDTASTSPGDNVQTHPPEQHQQLKAPSETKSEAEEKGATPVGDEGASSDDAEADKETFVPSSDEAASGVKETAAKVGEKASDVTERVKEAASDATDSAKEKAEGVAESAKSASGSSDDDEKTPPKKTSKNPQKYDPGDIAMKDAGSMNTTSGKQQGLSNDDTWHAVCYVSLVHSDRY
jgi:hypothetical protein